MAPSPILAVIFILTVSSPENRVHGLDYESPVVLSPEMYAYLHPKPQQASVNNLCESPDCYSLPLAANVQSINAHDRTITGGRGLAARGIAGIPVGLIFACLIMVGVCYVATKRQVNAKRAKMLQLPDV